MPNRLLEAPYWLVGLLSGLLYGALMGLALRYLAAEEWPAVLIFGAVTALLLGVAMGFIVRRAQRTLSAVGGDALSREQRLAATKATQHGRIPSDPAVRAVAVELARRDLARVEAKWPRVVMIIATVGVVLGAVMTFLDGDSDWWRAIPPLGLAVLLIFQLVFWPRRLRRRVAALSVDPSTGRPDGSVA